MILFRINLDQKVRKTKAYQNIVYLLCNQFIQIIYLNLISISPVSQSDQKVCFFASYMLKENIVLITSN